MRSVILGFTLMTLLPLMSCQNAEGPATPLQLAVLLNANFDSAGHASLSGFHDSYPIFNRSKAIYSFSADVPNSDAMWSLQAFSRDSMVSSFNITVNARLARQSTDLRLLYWHKSSPKASYIVSAGFWRAGAELVYPSSGRSQLWAQDTITYTSDTPIDSVTIILSTNLPTDFADTSNYTLFSQVTLEEFY